MFAFAGETDTITFINSGRYFYGQCLVLLGAASTLAGCAGIGDEATGAMALGAGLLDREETLLQTDLTASLTGRTGLGSVSYTHLDVYKRQPLRFMARAAIRIG